MTDPSQNTQQTEEEQKKPKKEKTPPEKRSAIKEELKGAQAEIEVKEETAEELEKSKFQTFFEGIFGENNRVSNFLTEVTTWFADKLGLGGDERIEWDEFSKEIAKAEKDASGQPFDIEEYIVSHRAMGYGRHKENSKEAIEAALEQGEKQIEIDIRLGKDGEIYLAHDPIKNEENPKENLTSLDDALKLFAEYPDVVIFFDVKEEDSLDKLIEQITSVDNENQYKEDYIPIAERLFLTSFNENLLKKAQEKLNPPLMFCYIPTCKLAVTESIIDMFGLKGIQKMVQSLDSLTGTNLTEDLTKISLKLNGDYIPGCDLTNEDVFNIYSELPSEEIMTMLKKSNGYICIPAPLATKELVANARKQGVKVAVWGANGEHIQRAIAYIGADLVISDKPDVMENPTPLDTQA